MTGRRELEDVAAGILGSFVSRNNDINGYWALGQLRSLAEAVGLAVVRLDLLRCSAEPSVDLSRAVAATYRRRFEDQLRRRRIPLDRVSEVVVVLDFGLQDPASVIRWASYGEPCSCSVSLLDDHSRTYTRSLVLRCGPHDPRRELRSSRS